MTMNNGNVTPKDGSPDQKAAIDGQVEDLSQMTKGHTGMKILVVVMGVAILALTFLIAMKVMTLLSGEKVEDKKAALDKAGAVQAASVKKAGQDNSVPPATAKPQDFTPKITIARPKGATLMASQLSGDILMLRYQMKSGDQHIQLIDMISGKIISRIDLPH